MNIPQNAIVVGIDSDGTDSAVAFAVEEGRRAQRPVHLVHVLHMPAGDGYADLYGEALAQARATLAAASAYAHELAADEVVVSSEVKVTNWLEHELITRTGDERLLVLQHRDLSRLRRVFTGSVVQTVAGRARGPVVSVPEGWTPEKNAGPVTVAVQDPVEAPALLRTAFEEARARKSALVVLHAWWLASGYDVVVVDNTFRAEWTDRTHEELEPVLAPLRADFPDVEVSIDVRHAPPIEAVLDAAEASSLLVIGRRHHLLPLGSHLGPVVRAAIGHATSPVLITPDVAVAASSSDADAPPRTSDVFAPTY